MFLKVITIISAVLAVSSGIEYQHSGISHQSFQQYAAPAIHAAPAYHHVAAPVYHAAPVAIKAAPVYKHIIQEEHHAPAHYSFEYAVHDEHTGDIKEQKETREGDKVQGYYTLKEADGTRRIVHYTADKHSGFNAVVTHEGKAVHAAPVHAHHAAPVYHHAAPVYHHAAPAIVKAAPVYHAAPIAYKAAPLAIHSHAAPLAHVSVSAPHAHYQY